MYCQVWEGSGISDRNPTCNMPERVRSLMCFNFPFAFSCLSLFLFFFFFSFFFFLGFLFSFFFLFQPPFYLCRLQRGQWGRPLGRGQSGERSNSNNQKIIVLTRGLTLVGGVDTGEAKQTITTRVINYVIDTIIIGQTTRRRHVGLDFRPRGW